ncbi:aromatic acid exporter family protein [Dietzia aerolata]|uniref:Aromatic acid exporter family protein n=1 Tax=Dietzia aerolata TaxID=595984 RepID=A0ABV5JQK8_9ACTN|nr:FUSC family protein [Dietzia aerolata]MBB0969892.1 aromatic acid exporter family protein [Dietzia aerolata]
MSQTRTPPRLSAWRDRLDARALGVYAALPVPLRTRSRRLAYAFLPILQCGLAAGLAWFIAFDLLDHPAPFFAPISAAIALGTGMGRRVRRGIELVIGVVVGVGLGDLLIAQIGSGPWQIAVVVIIAMSAAVFLDRGALVGTQAASSAILVATLLPPGSAGGYERMVDAAVGGAVALLLMAIMPVHPLKRVRREAASLLGVASSVLAEVADGLEARDSDRIRAALQDARDTQPAIDTIEEQLAGARELVKLSPFYRRRRPEEVTLAAMLNPMDNGIRNIRVLARRAIVAVDDQVDVPPALGSLLASLSGAVELLAQRVAADPDAPTDAEVHRELRAVASRAKRELLFDPGLTETVMLAQIRSVLVDMMQVAGLSKISAVATLPPTVRTPSVEPELQEEWPDSPDRPTSVLPPFRATRAAMARHDGKKSSS